MSAYFALERWQTHQTQCGQDALPGIATAPPSSAADFFFYLIFLYRHMNQLRLNNFLLSDRGITTCDKSDPTAPRS